MEEVYFVIVGLLGLTALQKYGRNEYFIFVFIVFWNGLFYFIYPDAYDYFKIIIFAYGFFLFGKYIFQNNDKIDRAINYLFFVFTIAFWISYSITPFGIISALSQYFLKYLLPVAIYHWFKKVYYNSKVDKIYSKWIIYIIIIQVILSFIKLVTLGLKEGTVGSVEPASGQLGVVLPLISLIFYWAYKKGHFKRSDWLIVFSFLLIALASGKRTPVFLYPVFLFLLFAWVPANKRLMVNAVKILPLIVLLFYIGLRFIPTLNPENKVWGSFNPEYAYEYALRYQLGLVDGERRTDLIDSYGASAIAVFQKETYQNLKLENVLFGEGIYYFRILEEETFNETYASTIGVTAHGNLSAAFKDLMALGIIGFTSFFLINLMIINQTKGRLKWVLFFFYVYIYFFYTSNIFTQLPILLLILPVIFRHQNIYANK
jgi:hypothetical protein